MKRTALPLNEMIGKLNLLLALSAAVMALYFTARILQPYSVKPSAGRGSPMKGIEVVINDPLKAVQGFSLDLFKNKPLFPGSMGEETAQAKHNFELLGVSGAGKVLASVRDTVTGKVYYFSPGDELEEFRVIEIADNKVTLEADGKTMEISR